MPLTEPLGALRFRGTLVEQDWCRVKVKLNDIALPDYSHLRAHRGVTCHVGSHSVNFHPTQVNSPRLTPARQAGTRFTYPEGMEG